MKNSITLLVTAYKLTTTSLYPDHPHVIRRCCGYTIFLTWKEFVGNLPVRASGSVRGLPWRKAYQTAKCKGICPCCLSHVPCHDGVFFFGMYRLYGQDRTKLPTCESRCFAHVSWHRQCCEGGVLSTWLKKPIKHPRSHHLCFSDDSEILFSEQNVEIIAGIMAEERKVLTN